MSAPDRGMGTTTREVWVLKHPALDDSLVAGYDALVQGWLSRLALNWKREHPASESFYRREAEWWKRIAPIHREIYEQSTRETNLAIGVVFFLPFAASLGLTFFVTQLLSFIPPKPFFLLQFALWLGGCGMLVWGWVEAGARPRRAFRDGLPPRPGDAGTPWREAPTPLRAFSSRVSRHASSWADYIRLYPAIWPPTDGLPGELSVLQAICAREGMRSEAPDTWLVLHGLKLAERSDADLIVLTPFGVRLLEVKYWQGEIQYFNGRWRHINHFYGRYGVPLTDERPARDPLKQVRWQLGALRRILPPGPEGDWLRGAVVFSHPDSWLDYNGFPPGVDVLGLSGVPDWLERDSGRRLFDTRQLFVMARRLIRHDAQFNPHRFPDATPLDGRVRKAIVDWHADDRRYREAAAAYELETTAALENYARSEREWQAFRDGATGSPEVMEKAT